MSAAALVTQLLAPGWNQRWSTPKDVRDPTQVAPCHCFLCSKPDVNDYIERWYLATHPHAKVERFDKGWMRITYQLPPPPPWQVYRWNLDGEFWEHVSTLPPGGPVPNGSELMFVDKPREPT